MSTPADSDPRQPLARVRGFPRPPAPRAAYWVGAHATALAGGLMLVPAAAYAAYVQQFGVNVPFQDEWAMVLLYRLGAHGHLTLAALWAQHNENRMLFPNVILLGLEHASRFDTKVEMYGSLLLLLVAVALLALVYRRTVDRSLLWFVPAALLLFSWGQYAVALQGFALALYLVVLCLTVSLAALAGAERRPWLLAVAVGAATVGSFSSAQGLAIWGAGLVFLIVRHRSRSRVGVWIGSAVVVSAIYLVGFHWGRAGGGGQWVVANPRPALHFFVLLVAGAALPAPFASVPLAVRDAFGAAVWVLAAGAFLAWIWRRRGGERVAIGLSLITFGALIDVLITFGRAYQGLAQASSSRYTLFNLWLLAGVWLTYVVLVRERKRLVVRGAMAALVLVCLVQVALGYGYGLSQGRATMAERDTAISLVRHYRTAPPDRVIPLVYQVRHGFKPLAAFLAGHHLSVFSKP